MGSLRCLSCVVLVACGPTEVTAPAGGGENFENPYEVTRTQLAQTDDMTIAPQLSLATAWGLLAAVYFFPGLWKLRESGLDWIFSGNLQNQMYWKWYQTGAMPAWRIDRHPALVQLGALGVVLFELGFPLLLWRRGTRACAAALGLVFMGVVFLLLFERGPSWHDLAAAFTAVEWQWVVLAIALNLVSVVMRALAWRTVIHQAMPAPYPSTLLVFSAFSVGLFANAVLPGRIGELARVGVLTRKLPRRRGYWAALVGTVFAHRVFDVVPVVLLILYVLATAKIPAWAVTLLLAREIAVTGLRSIASSEGVVIAAGDDGKTKTALQMVGILCLIIGYPYHLTLGPIDLGVVDLVVVGRTLVYISLAFSISSAFAYVRLFDAAVEAKAGRRQ